MSWIFPLVCLAFMVAMMLMCRGRGGGWMSRGHRSASSPDGARETPRQFLDRRLALGQITVEQHDSMRRDLQSPGGNR